MGPYEKDKPFNEFGFDDDTSDQTAVGRFESAYSQDKTQEINRLKREQANLAYRKTLDGYRSNGGNVMAQFLEANKPKKDTEKVGRLQNAAKFQAIGEALSLVGKGIGAFNGVQQRPMNNRPLLSTMNDLYRIDDLYDRDIRVWDSQRLRAAMQQEQDEQANSQFAINNAYRDYQDAQAREVAYNNLLAKRQDDDKKLALKAWETEQKHQEKQEDFRNRKEIAYIRSNGGHTGSSGASAGRNNKRIKTEFIHNDKLVQLTAAEADKLYNEGLKHGIIKADYKSTVGSNDDANFQWSSLSPEAKNNYYRKVLDKMSEKNTYNASKDPVMANAKDEPKYDRSLSVINENNPEFQAFLARPEIKAKRQRVPDHVLYELWAKEKNNRYGK